MIVERCELKQLAVSVLLTAIDNYYGMGLRYSPTKTDEEFHEQYKNVNRGLYVSKKSLRGQAKQDYKEAILFIESTEGCWYESRRTWCDLAGYDPDKLRRCVLALTKKQYEKFSSEKKRLFHRENKGREKK